MVITKTQRDLKPVLMDSTKKGVDNPYYQILEDGQIIFVVSPGLNGSEYNKTTVFLNDSSGVQVCQSLYGQGIILMQRIDEAGEAKEFKVVSLFPGRQVNIPTGWALCLVNVGKSFLVVIANIDVEGDSKKSKGIIEKQGLVYYVVEKKGEIGFEPNPNYRIHPQISTE